MATVIEEFVAFLGWEVDDKELKQFQKSTEKLKKQLGTATKAISIAAGALTGLLTITNKQTAQQEALAQAVGISGETLDALTSVVGELGFDFEKVVDLVEEMNNKIGESKGVKQMSSVKDAVKILGLDFQKIKDLKPEDQFIKILDAAKELKDEQKAVSAVDMLMGGDANKILGFLRTQEGSLKDIIARRKEILFLNEEGRKGAVKFSRAFGLVTTIAKSLSQQLAGLVGEALSPMINELVDWIRKNRELIKSEMLKWVERLTTFIVWFWRKVVQLGQAVAWLTDVFGGFGNVLGIIVGLWSTLLGMRIVRWVKDLVPVLKKVNKQLLLMTAKIGTAVAAWLLLGLAIEDLIAFFKGEESFLGDLGEIIATGFGDAMDAVLAYVGLSEKEILEANLKIANSFDWIVEKIELAASSLKWLIKTAGSFLGIGAALGSVGTEGAGGPLAPRIEGLSRQARGFQFAAPGAQTFAPSQAIDIKMNVTQKEGESGVEFGNRVTDQLTKLINQQAAQAARNNKSNVER